MDDANRREDAARTRALRGGSTKVAKPDTDTARDANANPSSRLRPVSITFQLRSGGGVGSGPGGSPAEDRRYTLENLLGVGATSSVYATKDTDLDRNVAVKILAESPQSDPQGTEKFLQEAALTASLSHANIPPVYDIQLDERGHPCCISKIIDGISLDAAIDGSSAASVSGARAGKRHPCIDSVAKIVNVLISVSQATAYTHSLGIVHQDIKPANIMIAKFGEVLLVDWGCAIRLQEAGSTDIYGTPLYMSPEQARRERVDKRSDVYSLGATLFHALFLRVPTWSDSAADFMEKKSKGIVDPLSAEELAGVPMALVDIVMKALAADAEARYQDAGEMVLDLVRFQNGLRVLAHRESILTTVLRWHRRNFRMFWTAAVALASLVAVIALVYGERLAEFAEWGTAINIENPASPRWARQWATKIGSFSVQGEKLVSTGDLESAIFFTEHLEGDSAIEFDGELLPGNDPCDISVMWARDIALDKSTGRVAGATDAYVTQFGSYDDSCSVLATPQSCIYSNAHPEVGKTYHVRVEIEGSVIRMMVDGRLLLSSDEPFPFAGGYFGLRAWYPGKAFSHVRIFDRGLPKKIPATALGDGYARGGDFVNAARAYGRVYRSHPGTLLGDDALYRHGLCLYRQNDVDQAFRIWAPLLHTDMSPMVRMREMDLRFLHGEHQQLLDGFPALFSSIDARQRIALEGCWAHYMTDLMSKDDAHVLEKYRALRDQLFPDEPSLDFVDASALVVLGRNEDVLKRYPHLHVVCCRALLAMGRPEIVIHDYPEQRWLRSQALVMTGQSEQINPADEAYGIGLVDRGDPQQALEKYPDHPYVVATALCALGRFDEAQRIAPPDTGQAAQALCLGGRASEVNDPAQMWYAALAQTHGDELLRLSMTDDRKAWAGYLLGIEALAHGDRGLGQRRFAEAMAIPSSNESTWLNRGLMVPFVTAMDGEPAPLRESLSRLAKDRYRFEQKPWFQARLLQKAISVEEFLAQPHHLYAEAEAHRTLGMRWELSGDTEQAIAEYRAFLEQPLYRRGAIADPTWEIFARWRIAQLEARRQH